MRRLLLLVLLAACAPEVAVEPCTACVLTDANSYAYTSELHIGSLPVAEAQDAAVRWDGLTRDLRGDPLDPLAIAEARLVAFRDLSPSEVAYGLSHDALAQADVTAYVTCAPEAARCALSDFGMFGNSVDIQQYFVEGYATWLLALGGDGVASVDGLAFLEPRADEVAAEARVRDDTSSLVAEVNLRSLEPVYVTAFEPALALDWSGVTRDGRGEPLDADTVDELWVGRFSLPIEALEADALELEALADNTWTMDVVGATNADLAALSGEVPFPGVGDEGTWLAALRCRGCTNPAPRLLTVLTAETR